MKYVVLFLFMCGSFALQAQDKQEFEYKVKANQVPKTARAWLRNPFSEIKKVKWYFEETSGKESYEAKFTYKGAFYSVEFSVEGIIEDIEIDRDWEELTPEIQGALQTAFDSIPKFNLRRIQEQWTGTPDDLHQAMRDLEKRRVTLRFEIEFIAEIKEEHAFWEGTFSPDGQLLHYRKIILRPTDNLDF